MWLCVGCTDTGTMHLLVCRSCVLLMRSVVCQLATCTDLLCSAAQGAGCMFVFPLSGVKDPNGIQTNSHIYAGTSHKSAHPHVQGTL
jgi:hypothetical protein